MYNSKDKNKKYTKKDYDVNGNFYLFANAKTQKSGKKYGFDNTKKAEQWFQERMNNNVNAKNDIQKYSDIEKSLLNISNVEKTTMEFTKNEYSTPHLYYDNSLR